MGDIVNLRLAREARASGDNSDPFCRRWFGTRPRTSAKVGLVVRPRRRPLELAQTSPALRVSVWRAPGSSSRSAGQPARPSRPSCRIAHAKRETEWTRVVARCSKARAEKEKRADANRAQSGRSKAERAAQRAERERLASFVDGHKRGPAT
ncbi:MAG: DUF4169 family protein [Rhizobiaceae bacterium]